MERGILPAGANLVTVISVFLRAGRARLMTIVFVMIGLIACGDLALGSRASLGLLYVLPMVLAATVFESRQIIALAVLCAFLRAFFDAPELAVFLRIPFALVTYAGAGLFALGIIRSRAASLELLASIRHERGLRREVEEQLNILVESSPAAIFTVNSAGNVIAANKAATGLLMLPEGEELKGRPIGAYLPILQDALQFESGHAELRTSAQCQGVRDNGEIFLASTWFSTWNSPEGKRLAAIVVDSSEEMRDREEENLRELTRANQIAAMAVAHEVRNFCSAIGVVSANLSAKRLTGPDGEKDEDLQALNSLAKGLERIASIELGERGSETLEELPLKAVLDDLRIVIEPQWREIGGVVHWKLPQDLPRVLAEKHGLLQIFLNLAQNSHRAVQDRAIREMTVEVRLNGDDLAGQSIVVKFCDSGPGVAAPDRLFSPFQPGADGTGIGLYLSRAVVRGYGGDLRWEPEGETSCFSVELQRIEGSDGTWNV